MTTGGAPVAQPRASRASAWPVPAFRSLPPIRWDDIAAEYRALTAEQWSDAWVARWTALELRLEEADAWLHAAHFADTRDEVAYARHMQWASDIAPRRRAAAIPLMRRVLDAGPDDEVVVRTGMTAAFPRFRVEVSHFRDESLPLQAELSSAIARWDRCIAGLTATWGAEPHSLTQLQHWLASGDRGVRQDAFLLSGSMIMGEQRQLAALTDRMMTLRRAIADRADCPDYYTYAVREHDVDETLPPRATVRRAIEQIVVPVATELLAARAERLGVSRVRPWDLHAGGTSTPSASISTSLSWRPLVRAGNVVAQHVHPEIADALGAMFSAGHMDIAGRAGKIPGCFCWSLPESGSAFLMMNATGSPHDIRQLLHEAGHALHFRAMARHPLWWHRQPPLAVMELAAIGLELLAEPVAGIPGGFYPPEVARQVFAHHLEEYVLLLASMAKVDTFVEWLYTDPTAHGTPLAPAARDAYWLALGERFDCGVDWGGLETANLARWYRHRHLHVDPASYLTYGIAFLGAAAMYVGGRDEPSAAVDRYLRMLALGSTRPAAAVFAEGGGGGVLAMDELSVRTVMDGIVRAIHELRQG